MINNLIGYKQILTRSDLIEDIDLLLCSKIIEYSCKILNPFLKYSLLVTDISDKITRTNYFASK